MHYAVASSSTRYPPLLSASTAVGMYRVRGVSINSSFCATCSLYLSLQLQLPPRLLLLAPALASAPPMVLCVFLGKSATNIGGIGYSR